MAALERSSHPPANDDARLARRQSGIEAIAVEVERISEGQRFVTRLLAERPPASLGRRDATPRETAPIHPPH